MSNNEQVKRLRLLYKNDKVARVILDLFGNYRRKRRITTVAYLVQKLGALGHDARGGDVSRVFKELESLRYGTYVAGRRNHPAHFRWNPDANRIEVGKIAAGKLDKALGRSRMITVLMKEPILRELETIASNEDWPRSTVIETLLLEALEERRALLSEERTPRATPVSTSPGQTIKDVHAILTGRLNYEGVPNEEGSYRRVDSKGTHFVKLYGGRGEKWTYRALVIDKYGNLRTIGDISEIGFDKLAEHLRGLHGL